MISRPRRGSCSSATGCLPRRLEIPQVEGRAGRRGERAAVGPALGAERAVRPPVVVLAPDDVVLAEVGAVLDLDDHDPEAAGVLDPVPGTARHDHRPPGLEPARPPADHDARRPRDHRPVLGTVAMALEADAVARVDHEALDLVARAVRDGLVASPGPRHESARSVPGGGLRSGHGARAGLRRRGGHHVPRRMTRAKSASTALETSSTTSAVTSSSRSRTTMARPRLVRRPTCMEAILTLWRPRMEPILPTMPGRSSYESTRTWPSGMNSMCRSRSRTIRGAPSNTVPAMIFRPAPACVVTVTRLE